MWPSTAVDSNLRGKTDFTSLLRYFCRRLRFSKFDSTA